MLTAYSSLKAYKGDGYTDYGYIHRAWLYKPKMVIETKIDFKLVKLGLHKTSL